MGANDYVFGRNVGDGFQAVELAFCFLHHRLRNAGGVELLPESVDVATTASLFAELLSDCVHLFLQEHAALSAVDAFADLLLNPRLQLEQIELGRYDRRNDLETLLDIELFEKLLSLETSSCLPAEDSPRENRRATTGR